MDYNKGIAKLDAAFEDVGIDQLEMVEQEIKRVKDGLIAIESIMDMKDDELMLSNIKFRMDLLGLLVLIRKQMME